MKGAGHVLVVEFRRGGRCADRGWWWSGHADGKGGRCWGPSGAEAERRMGIQRGHGGTRRCGRETNFSHHIWWLFVCWGGVLRVVMVSFVYIVGCMHLWFG